MKRRMRVHLYFEHVTWYPGMKESSAQTQGLSLGVSLQTLELSRRPFTEKVPLPQHVYSTAGYVKDVHLSLPVAAAAGSSREEHLKCFLHFCSISNFGFSSAAAEDIMKICRTGGDEDEQPSTTITN